MRWEVKAAVQATLSRVPGGYRLHRKMQDLAGSSRLDAEVQYGRKQRFLARVLAAGLPIRDRTFLEVGTGWHPLTPLLLHLLGAREVVTVDINPWLDARSLGETLDAVWSLSDRIAADFGLSAGECRSRLERLRREAAVADASPEAVLAGASIRYRMPLDACSTGLPAASFDYLISSNVFEHVPPEVLRGILRESRRILRPGGVHLHHVNPGDHFSYDPRITSVNFLRYSRRAWRYLGGSGLAYHNRLRCVDYVRLFEQEGFTVLYRDAEIDPAALRALRGGSVRPHPDFSDYTPEELSEHIIDVFAQLPVEVETTPAREREPVLAGAK